MKRSLGGGKTLNTFFMAGGKRERRGGILDWRGQRIDSWCSPGTLPRKRKVCGVKKRLGSRLVEITIR